MSLVSLELLDKREMSGEKTASTIEIVVIGIYCGDRCFFFQCLTGVLLVAQYHAYFLFSFPRSLS